MMKKAKIVLIEDNPADVLLVKEALRDHGIFHSLTHFESGREAVLTLCKKDEEDETPPDAILLDLNTPRSDGFAVLAKLKQTPHLAGVPIAVFSSSRSRTDKHRAAINGARYIEKPSQLQSFLATVGTAVKEMLASSAA